MDVGMVRIAVDCGEGNGLRKCLLEEAVGQIPNLLVGGWDIRPIQALTSFRSELVYESRACEQDKKERECTAAS